MYVCVCAYVQATFKGDDLGKHLTGVTDLLEKHGIAESGVSLHAERCKQLIAQSQKFVDTEDEKDVATINILQKQQALQAACDSLLSSSSTRRARLEASHSLQQFLSSVQEEEVRPITKACHMTASWDYSQQLQQQPCRACSILLSKHES